MIISFSCKTLWKVEELFLEDEKIVLTLNYFFIVGSFFNAEGSVHDSTDSIARILGKEGADALLDAEELGELK